MKSAWSCGLDRLCAAPEQLRGRSYGLLANQASLDRDFRLIQQVLSETVGKPTRLFAPEHGFFSVEQDMVAAAETHDPVTDAVIGSLYGDSEESLRPEADAFRDLEVLVVDLPDIGTRYYTYAATAVWAAEVALEAGCEVWVLDRPNPLGGVIVEGNLPEPGFESFVGAFRLPVRHGLTLAELTRLEARRRGWDEAGLRLLPCEPWDGSEPVGGDGNRPWVAPSPNMPNLQAARLFPGLCLLEATEFSEGRGTTRPFQLLGAPGLDPSRLARRIEQDIEASARRGIRAVPSLFRPQFQKHAGAICAGVELVVTGPVPQPFRFGLELLRVLREEALASDVEFSWRQAAYEFRSDHPALDLLCGSAAPRQAIERGGSCTAWLDDCSSHPHEFVAECRERQVFLYDRDR